MSIAEAEDVNEAELTPDQPCAICGAEHDKENGTVVGRLDPESDIPIALPSPDAVNGDPYELSFCNHCLEDYFTQTQSSIKVLNPRQTQAAAYMLLGLTTQETYEAFNGRDDVSEDGLGKGAVRDYRTRARRGLREAMQLSLGGSPILKQAKQN